MCSCTPCTPTSIGPEFVRNVAIAIEMTSEENSDNTNYPENSNSESNYPSSSHEDSEVDYDETDSKVNFAAKKVPVRVSSKLNK